MRFPNDTAFHLRMAAIVLAALFVEQLAQKHVPFWTSPQIGVVSFAVGLMWVALAAFHHAKATQDRLRAVEARLERVQALADALADDVRSRRSLPRP